jgi:dihydrofolate reductase
MAFGKVAFMARRKIIVYIATSADGYIARLDGKVDWLNRPRPKDNYGMGAFFKSIDTILWGRKTYDLALGYSHTGGGMGYGKKIKNYVFTHDPPKSEVAGVEFVNEPIAEFASRLRAQPGKDIWMMGGGGIVTSFLDAGELDELIIHVIPTFIGVGVPLMQPGHREVDLKLLSSKSHPDGVVRLHYAVEKAGNSNK